MTSPLPPNPAQLSRDLALQGRAPAPALVLQLRLHPGSRALTRRVGGGSAWRQRVFAGTVALLPRPICAAAGVSGALGLARPAAPAAAEARAAPGGRGPRCRTDRPRATGRRDCSGAPARRWAVAAGSQPLALRRRSAIPVRRATRARDAAAQPRPVLDHLARGAASVGPRARVD
eukprot:scaffold1394_cov109-Isochrysis_galbana.AAC.9